MSHDKRHIDVLVLSDIHLGTYGCHAKELLHYLRSIQPKRVILNGDIIDIWQFSKRYWPKSHMQVVRHILGWVGDGIPVDYITGNHDELLRRFEGFKLGTFRIQNKLLLEMDGKEAWFFHGDVFDVTMQHSKWLAKLGAIGYDTLILINRTVNHILLKFGKERISLSKRIKNSVKNAVKYIQDFEQTAADLAIEKKYKYVCCGHIHQPCIKKYVNQDGHVTYLNSGDWVENLTALEYSNGSWEIYNYEEDKTLRHVKPAIADVNHNLQDLFQAMLQDFKEGEKSEKEPVEQVVSTISARMFIQH